MKDKPQSVLLVVHEFSYTGAPLAVLETALALRKKGYKVHTLTFSNAKLSERFEQENLDYSVYENDEKLKQLASTFDFAIVNTLNCFNTYNILKSFMPATWWIHEKLCLAPNKEETIKDVQNAFSIITSSPLSRVEYLPYNPNNHLIYCGIKDAYKGAKMPSFPSFALIGTIQPKKGQDLFIRAIKQLPEETRQKAGFFIIGPAITTRLREQIVEFIKDVPEITLLPPTPSFDEMCEYYENINALVVPSREEPTSRVAIEAMMMGRPVIMSDVVGAQYLVEEGVNGFIFKTEDVDKLSEILARVIEHPEILEKMQQPAREAYLKYNSEEIFSNSLEDAILSDWKRYYK